MIAGVGSKQSFFASLLFNSKDDRISLFCFAEQILICFISTFFFYSFPRFIIIILRIFFLSSLFWPARCVTFYKNGDRYFKGIRIQLTPQRYLNFSHLLSDLTKWISLPYGVRRLYSFEVRTNKLRFLKSDLYLSGCKSGISLLLKCVWLS